jgi:VanZ family protein
MDEPAAAQIVTGKVWLLSWLPAILWAGLIFFMSAVPGDGLPEMPVPQTDKLIHAAVFLVLGAFCFRALARTTRLSPWPMMTTAALLATLYGAGDEVHQMFTPGRNSDVADALADAVGAAAGGLLMGAVKRHRTRRRDG